MSDTNVIELRIVNLENAVGEIKTAVKGIDASLQTLARLEVHHSDTRDSIARAFSDIEDHEERIRALEIEAPTSRMVKSWVITGVLFVIGLAGLALFRLIGLSA